MQTKQTLRPSPTAILNPRLDVNFKAMFTQETKESYAALQSFLSSVLNRKIRTVSLTTNEPVVDAIYQMQMSFDVAVTFDDGEKASIEMQGRDREYDYSARSEIQVARLLNNNVKKNSKWKAEKVYQISVLNFHLPKDDKCEMSWYTMKNQKGHKLSDHMNVIFIDLLEIKKLYETTPIEKLTSLQKWGLFLSYADDESKSDFIRKITESEKGIMEAELIIGRMSEEDSNWFRQNSIDTAIRDRNSEIDAAEERGIEKGMKKQAVESAKKFLKMNFMTPEQISQGVGLTVEEVLELSKKIKK